MKQLRENFSSVKKQLERGKELLLIYRSQPLAEMIPVKKFKKRKKPKKSTLKENLELIDKLAGGLRSKVKWTPESLNKAYDKQYKEMLSGY